MEIVKIDGVLNYEEEIKKYLKKDETVVYKYEVVPLDIRISNYMSPIFYITSERLFFFFDDALEIYKLTTLTIEILGEKPNFEIYKIILESYPKYIFEYRKELEELKLKEGLTKISINEEKQVPKYFLVRNGLTIQKSFKTWALYRLLLNMKNSQQDNGILTEMLNGFFSQFNQKTILNFVFVFVGYVVLRMISQLLLPDLVGTILDVLFGIILVLLGYWLYLSSEKNFKRYYKYYLNNVSN